MLGARVNRSFRGVGLGVRYASFPEWAARHRLYDDE